ncbi:TonB-dependent receptor plug domain-containing protein [Maribellus sp. YY47]|uniref:TonB-dependent receptor plug domain-containing protein n=1 Tax=Maribellus sp. YY47 TaxID=2929486 RepID=UPI0020014FE0|nr:TonB-dependent receptor plug domain-containing protein [Maribellus sp. YY47]MCK3684294.1 Plug domain-containing protein [Maribellus sp. YY47]
MKTKLILLFLFFAASCYQPLVAQKRDVKGKVTTFGEIPLNKVLITGKNLDKEYFSDENGNFSLVCDEAEKLTFEAHGFTSKKIKVSGFNEGDSIKVDLPYKKGEKYFEAATGYGHISEKQLNYAIAHLEAGPDYSAYRTIFEAIEGRVSGVSVGSNMVNIRGTTTLNEGPTPALLVVDGTIVEFSVFANIPPSQVKSIDVLKGAAASARYGTRGMGGVIVVKTKSGN